MKNKDLIRAYANGATSDKCGNLSINGDRLYSYYTCIAERRNGGHIINDTKYSPTTSRHQSLLRYFISDAEIVTGLSFGVTQLSPRRYSLTA